MNDACIDNKTNINHYLFLLLIGMNVIDFITTYIGITYFGATEKNPVMATAIEWSGTVWSIFLVKALVFGHIYYHYYQTVKGRAQWLLPRTTWILAILTAIFFAVVINNTIRILT